MGDGLACVRDDPHGQGGRIEPLPPETLVRLPYLRHSRPGVAPEDQLEPGPPARTGQLVQCVYELDVPWIDAEPRLFLGLAYQARYGALLLTVPGEEMPGARREGGVGMPQTEQHATGRVLEVEVHPTMWGTAPAPWRTAPRGTVARPVACLRTSSRVVGCMRSLSRSSGRNQRSITPSASGSRAGSPSHCPT